MAWDKDATFAVNSAAFSSGALQENPYVESDAPILLEKIKKAFLAQMPDNLKDIMLRSDAEFASWVIDRQNALAEMEHIFVVGGSVPIFSFTGGWYNEMESHPSTIPYAPVIGKTYTLWKDMIEQVQLAQSSLKAIVLLRHDYVEKVKAEVAKTQFQLKGVE